ncbi:proteoglycan 4-like [Arachis ipaensis]|uniref:proteoglycan 4-like n=1 Tax=Arachis ipaensis TaxID=130454 RepID=UPI0007AF8E45|nr:proteoglycan 4-like [Arachis ipaensis]XP_025653188.1 proteoglycan 4-like [Arachis hypogaea]
MRTKTLAKRPPREKIFKRSTKPATCSQDRTFTPSPSPPTSPPRTTPTARTKTTPRYPASAKPTPPPKATPFKPGSSKPGSAKPRSSKGKRPMAEEPVPEPTQPKFRSVPVRSQRGGGSVKQNKGPTRSERVVLDDEDDDFVPEDSSSLSTEGTSISTGKKSALLNVVKDVVQEFVSQSNHLIAMSKEQRKLASKHENFLKKPRDRVAVFMTFIDNLQKDEDPATDIEEEADSEGNGSDA